MILPLEQQVCSLESAKRLESLGVKQESAFYWVLDSIAEEPYIFYHKELEKLNNNFSDCISAYTCAELGEMLPDGAHSKQYRFGKEHKNTGWHVEVFESMGIQYAILNGEARYLAKTEAEARALILIYLYEQGLMK